MKNEEKQLTEITIKVKRVPAVIFGIIGVVISTILVFALVIYSDQILGNLIEGPDNHQTLLIVAVSLAISAVAFIILTILIVSIVSVWGRFNKGLRLVLFLFLVLALFLLIASAAVGGAWLLIS